jgi:hypothetical protein
MEEKYKEFKSRYDLRDKDIAEFFGYKNANSFRTSARYSKIVSGIVKVWLLIKLREKDNSI